MIVLKPRIFLQTFTKLQTNVNFCSSTVKSKDKWDLFTAVCLERKPKIIPELNKLEKEFQEYLADLELRNSLKNDFELRNEAEIKQLALLKSGGGDLETDITLKQTAQDFIDASVEEASKFKLANKITDDDKKTNWKSLNRKLDKHLVLVLNQKIGNKSHYLLPQDGINEGETLRQAAERILSEKLGNGLKAQIYSNAPAGFYKYKYPKKVRGNGSVGAKIFIYFARYSDGTIDNKSEFKWLDRHNLYKELPGEYGKSIRQFLIDE